MTRAAIIAALLFATSNVGQLAQPSELALALVRPDGILVPFAVFDGNSWVEAWLEPGEPIARDSMLAAVPSFWRKRQQQVPETWHVAAPAAAPRKVNVLSHVVFDEHCGHQVGLLTDLQPRRADSHDKRLAADRVVPITLPLDLSESANRDGWQDLVQLIEAEAARQESRAIANWERDAERKSLLEPPAQRQPVRIKRLYVHREPGSRILYFEAERKYANSIWKAPDGETSTLLVSGWVYQSAGSGPSVFVTQAVVTDIDFKGVVRMKPLGIIRAGGSTLWVGQEHGYEDEAVSLLRVDDKGVHQTFRALIGGC